MTPAPLHILSLYLSTEHFSVFFLTLFSSSAFLPYFFFLPPFFSTSNFVHRSDDLFPFSLSSFPSSSSFLQLQPSLWLCLLSITFSLWYTAVRQGSESYRTGPIRIQNEGASLQSDCQLLASSCCRAETIETDGQQMKDCDWTSRCSLILFDWLVKKLHMC